MTWREKFRPVVEALIRRISIEAGEDASPAAIARRVNAAAPPWVRATPGGWLIRTWRSEVRRQLGLKPTWRQAERAREQSAERLADRERRDAANGQGMLF